MNYKKLPKQYFNKFLRFTGIGVQLGGTLYLASLFGAWIDVKLQLSKPWFTLLLILLALIGFIYSLLKQLNKLNKEE